jgi:hypothetical protein
MFDAMPARAPSNVAESISARLALMVIDARLAASALISTRSTPMRRSSIERWEGSDEADATASLAARWAASIRRNAENLPSLAARPSRSPLDEGAAISAMPVIATNLRARGTYVVR